MRAFTAIFLCGALASGAVGCGESESNGAGNQDQFITQLCAEFADCCEAAGRPSDGAQCRAFYGAFVPMSGYDQAAAQACLNEVRAADNKCEDMSSMNTPSCAKVFASVRGTKQPGEACEDDDDCAPAASGQVDCASDFVDGATVQKCQVRLPGKAGSTPCVGTVDGNVTFYGGAAEGIPTTGYLCDLADGLSCDSQTGACESLAAVGEACSSGIYQCVPAAYCAFAEGMCKARLALGAACRGDDECQEAAYCAPSSSTCVGQRATGEACATNAECESGDCINQKCAAQNDLALVFLCGSN